MKTLQEIQVEISELMAEKNPVASDLYALKVSSGQIRIVPMAKMTTDPTTVCYLKGTQLVSGLTDGQWEIISKSTQKKIQEQIKP